MSKSTSTTASTTKQDDNRGTVTAIVVIILLLFIIIIATLLLMRHNAKSGGYVPDLDNRAVEWAGQLISSLGGSDDEEDGGIKIPGYSSIEVEAGSSMMYVSLLNPEGNPCYFTFTLTLADTGEVLFTTKMVAPGQVINEVEMNRSLEVGQYDAILTVSTASLEDGSAMNGANVMTVLEVVGNTGR